MKFERFQLRLRSGAVMLMRMLSLLGLLMFVGCMDLQSLSKAPNEVIERLDELRGTDPARAVVELNKQLEIHPKTT